MENTLNQRDAPLDPAADRLPRAFEDSKWPQLRVLLEITVISLIGWSMDHALATAFPIFLIVGFLLGLTLGVYHWVRDVL